MFCILGTRRRHLSVIKHSERCDRSPNRCLGPSSPGVHVLVKEAAIPQQDRLRYSEQGVCVCVCVCVCVHVCGCIYVV